MIIIISSLSYFQDILLKKLIFFDIISYFLTYNLIGDKHGKNR